MAKKKIQPRRVSRAVEPRMYGDGQPSTQAADRTATSSGPAPVRSATPAATARPAAPARPVAAPRAAATAARTPYQPVRPPVTMTTDYSYVLKDLRRLGILATGVFAVLIALGVIVR